MRGSGGPGRQTRVLVVGQTPPPVHGQAVCIARLVRGPLPGVRVTHLRMAYSSTVDRVGRFSWGKVAHLARLTGQAAWHLARNRGTVLYYPPGARPAPLLRDVVFLSLTRPLARATVLHFHAGGAARCLGDHRWLSLATRLALGRADAAVKLLPSADDDGAFLFARRTVVVPNGAEVKRLPRTRPPDDGQVRLLFVGLLGRSKGLDLAVSAVRALAERGLPVRLHAMGSWESDEQRREMAADLASLGDRVRVLGVLSGDRKWQQFADADVMLFPTRYRHEVMPVALLEAMGCGLPVVASRWRCLPDLVQHQKTGLLVPPDQLDPLVDALAELASCPNTRRRLGQAGRARFEAHFSLQRHLEAMAELFRQVDADARR